MMNANDNEMTVDSEGAPKMELGESIMDCFGHETPKETSRPCKKLLDKKVIDDERKGDDDDYDVEMNNGHGDEMKENEHDDEKIGDNDDYDNEMKEDEHDKKMSQRLKQNYIPCNIGVSNEHKLDSSDGMSPLCCESLCKTAKIIPPVAMLPEEEKNREMRGGALEFLGEVSQERMFPTLQKFENISDDSEVRRQMNLNFEKHGDKLSPPMAQEESPVAPNKRAAGNKEVNENLLSFTTSDEAPLINMHKNEIQPEGTPASDEMLNKTLPGCGLQEEKVEIAKVVADEIDLNEQEQMTHGITEKTPDLSGKMLPDKALDENQTVKTMSPSDDIPVEKPSDVGMLMNATLPFSMPSTGFEQSGSLSSQMHEKNRKAHEDMLQEDTSAIETTEDKRPSGNDDDNKETSRAIAGEAMPETPDITSTNGKPFAEISKDHTMHVVDKEGEGKSHRKESEETKHKSQDESDNSNNNKNNNNSNNGEDEEDASADTSRQPAKLLFRSMNHRAGRPRGLRNTGNTCYMNSMLQCLAACFVGIDESMPMVEHSTSLAHYFFEIIWLIYAKGERKIPIQEFKQMMGKVSVKYKSCGQQDAFQFLMCLLKNVETELKSHSLDIIADLFSCQRTTKMTCFDCQHEIRIFQTEYSLILSLGTDQGPPQIQTTSSWAQDTWRALINFGQTKIISFLKAMNIMKNKGLETYVEKLMRVEEDYEVFCPKCSGSKKGSIISLMTSLPKILTIYINRFDFDRRNKSNEKVTFETEDFKLKTSDGETATYRAIAFCEHFGCFEYGHYLARVRSRRGDPWFTCNDGNVKIWRQRDDFITSKHVYAIFYQREETKRSTQV